MDVKKIMFVSNTARSLYIFRLGLAEGLVKRNYDVVLCASDDEYAERLRAKKFKFIPLKIKTHAASASADLRLLFDLYKIYNREKPDLVLHFSVKPNIYGSLVARTANLNCINNVTGLGHVFVEKNFLTRIVIFLYKISFKYAKRIVFQNTDDLGYLTKNKVCEGNKAVLIKGSGVDINRFHPDFCKRINKKNDKFVFLFIGRMLWNKGVGELVSAARVVKSRYPDSEVRLLGRIDKGNPSGIPEETIEKWSREGVITYIGQADDVRSNICESNAVVLPSYYREGIPRALLEAIAMGKSIITTDSVGCRNVIEDGINGLSVPPRDANALALAMMRMIELPLEKRALMEEYGRRKAVEEFAESKIMDNYLDIIEEAVYAR